MNTSLPVRMNHRRAIWVAAVLAPTLAVQAVRIFGGPGLSSAPGAVARVPATEGGTPAVLPEARPPAPPTEAQRKAMVFAASHRTYTQLQTPMEEPPIEAPDEAVDIPEPEAAPEPAKVEPTPDLVVTAIIGSGSNEMAMIGGRLRRVGDEVAPGWTISVIHAHTRLVRIRHSDGRTAEFFPPSGGR